MEIRIKNNRINLSFDNFTTSQFQFPFYHQLLTLERLNTSFTFLEI